MYMLDKGRLRHNMKPQSSNVKNPELPIKHDSLRTSLIPHKASQITASYNAASFQSRQARFTQLTMSKSRLATHHLLNSTQLYRSNSKFTPFTALAWFISHLDPRLQQQLELNNTTASLTHFRVEYGTEPVCERWISVLVLGTSIAKSDCDQAAQFTNRFAVKFTGVRTSL